MNFSDILMNRIRDVKQHVMVKLDSKEAVIRNLAALYDACLASETLLLDAAQESWRLGDSVLSNYYASHFQEEKGEIVLLKEDLGDLVNRFPNPIVMAMIGTQYYLIKHVHPVCLLGYMAIMEADPTPIERVEKLEEAYGKDLFRFVRMHAIKDIEHAKELLEVIEKQPVKQQDLILRSANNALRYLYG